MTIIINPLNIGLLAAAPAGPNYCGPDEGTHFQQLKENWEKREAVRQKVFTDSVWMIDQALGLVDDKTVGAAAFNAGRRANFQAENWLLLDAAAKSTDRYFRSQDGDTAYLTRAIKYLDTALANADPNLSFDIYRAPFTKTIHPVESYFELQLARFQAMSLLDPGAALAYGKEIKAGLESRRILKAQRSDRDHAAGYINRLRILYGFAGLYNPAMDLNQALASVRQGRDWAKLMHDKNLLSVEVGGMNKKDLRYDTLLAGVIEARLLIKAGRHGEALSIFQALLKEPEAAKKFGGFLDIGQQAFFGIMHISLLTAGTLNQAAANFDRNLDWTMLADDKMADLRESLGLIIRGQNWQDKTKETLEQMTKRPVQGPSEIRGYLSLRLDWSSLAVVDDSPIKYELKPAACKTPGRKLGLFIKLLDHVDFPFDQKQALVSAFNALGGGKK